MNLFKQIKYYLTEMSIDKHRLEEKIDSKTDELIEYLLMCLLIQDTTNNLNHWSSEVYSKLPMVYLLKSNHKLPSEKLLYSFTIDRFSDILPRWIDGFVDRINMKENTNITNYDNQLLSDLIVQYYKWLIPILSEYGVVKPSDVKQQIKSLIQDYNKSTTKPKVGA